MQTNFLVTKLYAPLLRRDLVPRVRLVDQLRMELYEEQAFPRKLTLISAPAGYGKTTLAVAWLQSTGFPYAWLSLDEHDNDPVYFLTGLVSALRTVRPDLAEIHFPSGQGMGAPPVETLLTPFINTIASQASPFLLAIDDYHIIHNTAIHQMLNFLLENLPVCMHLVLVTREDPPVPLPRMRATGKVVEIRQVDLCFNRDEVVEFFRRAVGVEIGPSDLEALALRTEGWAVGLQMIALSLRSGLSLAELLQSFSGSHRFIMDYLIDEVFNKLPGPLQDFFLKVSIFDRFSAPLCDAVTGRVDSRMILTRLEASNSFIIPLDAVREWYRFHHLFRGLLYQKLRQAGEISEKDLHRVACTWYIQNGYPREAIQHALAGEDWVKAAEWIHGVSNGLLRQGEVVNLLGWFQKIPAETCARIPALAIDYAWPLILGGQIEKAERLLEPLESRDNLTKEQQGAVAAAQAYIARSRGDARQTMVMSQKALSLLPRSESHIRGILAVNLGISYWHIGRLAEAEQAMQEAYQASQVEENRYAELTSLIFLSRVQAARGHLRRAFQMYQPLREMAAPVPILALAHMDIATLHFEWNELEACESHLVKSIAIGEETRNLEFLSSTCNQMARLRLARNDLEGARAALDRAWQLLENQAVTPITRSRNAAAYLQLALSQGDLHAAESWSEQAGEGADAHPFYPFAGLSRARLLLAQGQDLAAQNVLGECAGLAENRGWGYARIMILILQSIAAGTGEEAAGFVREALALAQPEGFLRIFLEGGDRLVPLLHEAARRGIYPEYAGRIAAFVESGWKGQSPGDARFVQGNQALVEPLSERELEVLRLVAAGLSNQQIADQLVVGLSTVKSHVHHISGKLGAENRTQLVAIARDHTLI
jgi:LuxR family transcriptional regulator, maltose regulon positive regulatory protein